MTRRNQFRSPGIWGFDTALYKTFKITETSNIQLRAEVFNLFNHANLFIQPGTLDVSSGAVLAARGVTINQNFERRNVQLEVIPDEFEAVRHALGRLQPGEALLCFCDQTQQVADMLHRAGAVPCADPAQIRRIVEENMVEEDMIEENMRKPA